MLLSYKMHSSRFNVLLLVYLSHYVHIVVKNTKLKIKTPDTKLCF